MSLTPNQLAIRRGRVTATAVAKILGLYPWGTAIDVYLEARGLVIDTAGDAAAWGTRLEPVIRDDFERRHQVEVAVPGTLIHPTEDWAAATPDGVQYPRGTWIRRGPDSSHGDPDANPNGGLEVKCHSGRMSHLYGKPGTDEAPPWEICQCAWNRWICAALWPAGDFPHWDLVAFIDGRPTDYAIPHDPDLEEHLVEVCRTFHRDSIIGDNPPPPDGSERYSAWLADLLPQHTEDHRDATDYEVELVVALHANGAALEELHRDRAKIEQEIKSAIGEASGVRFPAIGMSRGKYERITWKTAADSTRVGWADVVSSVRGQLGEFAEVEARRFADMLDEAIKKHTRIQPGGRRFTVPRGFPRPPR